MHIQMKCQKLWNQTKFTDSSTLSHPVKPLQNMYAELLVSSAFAKLRIIHYLDLRSPAARCQTATHVRVWAFVTRCYIVTEWSVLHLLGSRGPWCNPRIDLMDHCESLSTFGLEAMGSLISISLTAVTTLNSRGGRKTKAASSRCLV